MLARNLINELSCDTNFPRCRAHRPFKDIAHAQLASDLLHVHRLALVGKAGIASDNEEPFKPRQRRSNLLNHSIGEVFLLGIAAHVLERQHGDGGLVGARKGALGRIARIWIRNFSRLLHLSDETKALARKRLDEALLLAGIADGSADSIQAGRKRSIGHNAAIPNGVDKVVLADDALPVSDQVFEQIEHLWCNRNDLCAAMQFAPVDVKCEFLEAIAQVTHPSQCPSYAGRHLRTPKNKPLACEM